jgi:hypothetical protein
VVRIGLVAQSSLCSAVLATLELPRRDEVGSQWSSSAGTPTRSMAKRVQVLL